MKIEDYNKFYIQGSDHYLIPKDIFDELFNEMSNWKEEAKELKKQLEDKEKKYIPGEYAKEEFIKEFDENILLKNQQKKFIEYLEYQVKLQEELNDIHLATGFEEILQKYKSIIGDDK